MKAIKGILALFVIFYIIGRFAGSSSSKPSAPTPAVAAAQSAAAQEKEKAKVAEAATAAKDLAAAEAAKAAKTVVRHDAARDLMAASIKQGFVKRMNLPMGKFYVDRQLWEVFELHQKEQIVKAISDYREAEDNDNARVWLYDSRSGKELASYNSWSGVTIN